MGIKKTTEQFKQEVHNLVGDEYEVLSEYKNTDYKVSLRHNKCGNIFNMRPHDFLKNNGNRCPKCANKNRVNKSTKTQEDFIKEVYESVNDEYTVLGKYVNNKTKIEIRHNKCGNSWFIKPNRWLCGDRCPYCNKGGYISDTINSVSKEISDKTNNEYEVISSSYSNNKEKIEILHKKCNKTFKMRMNDFRTGHRCPYCKRSLGEEKIEKFLESKDIQFETQYIFDDLVYKRKLKFDVRILCENPNDYLLIEYDGYFHEDNKYSKKALQEQQYRDKLKDEYCKNHDNIILYRINYRDYDNIESILDKIIKKYS